LLRERRGATPRSASREEALERIALEFKHVQEQFWRDAVGVFGRGGITNEKVYLLGKLARVALRTSSIDYNGGFCMSLAAAAGIMAFGIDCGLPFPLADIPHAVCAMRISKANVAGH
jgi:assimilatory nitrate reductase catalytic subunit